MIAAEGDTLACLGGWRGDVLYVTKGGSPLRRVAELGFDARTQTTPQRRLLLAGDSVLVLEPVEGPFLLPPLRVRRFDFSGREVAREEGEGVRGTALLSFYAKGSKVTRCGIDPATGRPTVEVEDVQRDLSGRLPDCSGIPLFAGGALYYAVRGRGLYRGGERLLDGDPATPQLIGGEVVCAAHRGDRPGLFRNGSWHPLEGGRLFPPWRAPLGPQVAPFEGGLLVIRREGGDLPALGAPPARLVPGIYSALADLGGRLHAVAEAEVPTLVPLPPGGPSPPGL